VRPVSLKGQTLWSFVHTHQTRDITKNLAPPDAVERLRTLLETRFQHAHLFAPGGEVQLLSSKKGKRTLLRPKSAKSDAAVAEPDVAPAHDRERKYATISREPFLFC